MPRSMRARRSAKTRPGARTSRSCSTRPGSSRGATRKARRSPSISTRSRSPRTPTSWLDAEEIEEERRLLYVGMTRARDELTLTLAGRRLVYGKVQYRSASRFVEEIPAEALEQLSAPRAARPTIFEPVPEDVPRHPLVRGRRVQHPRYGYGVILAQEGSGDETRLTVYFDRAGKKKCVARYADLTPA